VPEFEPRPPLVPPFIPSARAESDADNDFELMTAPLEEELRPQREGLPPGYRMRTEAHYVDQLVARAPVPQIRAVPIGDIDCPRPVDTATLEPLVRSIAAHGVLQPLLVRGRAGRLDVISGARRLAAATRAGLTYVPCVVHTCDEARARAIQEAADVRGSREEVRPTPPDTAAQGLQELAHSLGSIESCLQLLGGRETALRDRVAINLLRAEAASATRLMRCLAVLTSEPHLARAEEPLEPLIDEVVHAFDAECRLSGASIELDVSGTHVLALDRRYFAIGLAGALDGMLALVRDSRTQTLDVRVSSDGTRGPVVVEIAQHAITLGTGALARLFDVRWTDRPGGYQAAVGLAAARRIVDLHEGTLQAEPGGRGGCRLLIRLRPSTR
jgi:signal transduction histidine kinase